MFGKLNGNEIDRFLHQQLIGRIGCQDNGIVYVVPISYVFDDDYLYAHTGEGMKIEIMRNNPDVCFETDDLENMANWKSVICWGKFEEIRDEKTRTKAIQKLATRVLPNRISRTVHLFPEFPFLPENVNTLEGVVFRIKLEKKTGRFEKYEPAMHNCG